MWTRSLAVLSLLALLGSRPAAVAPLPVPTTEQAVLHALNRLTFGPRPGDVERVRSIGLQAWIDQQLAPSRIDDRELVARLARLETLGLDSRTIQQEYSGPAMVERRRRQLAGNREPGAGNPEMSSGGARSPEPGARQPNEVLRKDRQVIADIEEAKLLRAVYSERQLEEVLVDFWFNHFNVFAGKGATRNYLNEYERDAVRPHVLGNFRELLGATAKNPAMLFYLDNWLNVAESSPGGASPRRGINENYARELMELHTLGVDGGYTQKDVTEVARAFTGWTIDNPRQGGAFRFEPRIHDDAEKTILGRRIEADGGIADGEQVLDLLASHPSTARFISTKLARRFIADTPPAALVDRLAARFRATGGDLRAVMTTLLTSPEFLSLDAYRAKVKTPFEYVVSAVRATGAEVLNVRPLARSLEELGMPLYQCQPPTGYKDVADAWTSTGALVGRINFALALTSGRLPPPSDRGVAQDFSPARPGVAPGVVQDFGPAQPSVAPGVAQDFSPTRQSTPESIGALRRGRGVGPMATLGRGFIDRSPAALTRWEAAVEAALAHDLSPTTRATIARAATPAERVALVLGSPEFQKR